MKSRRAKVLHPVLGVPMVCRPVGALVDAGVERIVVVVGHQADEVERVVRERFPNVELRFALQDKPAGTGHAVRSALPALADFAGRVLITAGDIPLLGTDTIRRFIDDAVAADAAYALLTARLDDPTGYGRIVRSRDGDVLKIVEQKDATSEERRIHEINLGIYLVNAALLAETVPLIQNDNAPGEYYLTDTLELARERGVRPKAFVMADAREAEGVNDHVQLAAREKLLLARTIERLQRAGVAFRLPETTWVESDVHIGPDSEIGPHVVLKGRTVIGAGVTIGAGCVVTDSTIADGTVVLPYSVFTEAQVGAGGRIGPFSHLRPKSVLADDVHVGNFVETKATTIAAGSKANHLSYLGDAEIGRGVNVGAGTITCNYDGYVKSKTIIDDGAFIGSDSALVAPVRIGARAVVGAGSTITADVAPESLVVTRAPVSEKPGYYGRKHAKMLAAGKVKAKG